MEMYKTINGKNDVNLTSRFELAHFMEGAASTRSTSGALNVVRNEGRNEIRSTSTSLQSLEQLQPTNNFFKIALDNISAGGKDEHPRKHKFFFYPARMYPIFLLM